MKSTGIIRKIDELGRIVIPMELRKTFGIDCKDSLEIYVEDGNIVLSKYEPSCVFCGKKDQIVTYKNKNICESCRQRITMV